MVNINENLAHMHNRQTICTRVSTRELRHKLMSISCRFFEERLISITHLSDFDNKDVNIL